MEPIEIENKYCYDCENRVGKKESKEWIYYTEVLVYMSTYNYRTHDLDTISFYTCIDCQKEPPYWECKTCNQIIHSTNEFCDDSGNRKCYDCIITEVFNRNLECKCNVCCEANELYTITPK